MDFELLLWQAAFFLYVWLHLGGKWRRFYSNWKKQKRAQNRNGRGWF